MKTNPLSCLLALCYWLALAVAAAADEVLYQTGFEAPAFTSGTPIRGQDSWEMWHAGEAIAVSDEEARTGAQCLRFEGALLEPTGPGSQAYCFYFRSVDEVLNDDASTIVEVQVDVRLDGPRVGINGSPAEDLFSANFFGAVLLPNGNGSATRLGGFFVSSSGNIWSSSPSPEGDYKFSVPYSPGTYRTLKLRYDFIALTVTRSIDGVELGVSPIPESLAEAKFSSAYLEVAGQVAPVNTPEITYDRANYTALYDNYRISYVTVPANETAIRFTQDIFPADEADGKAIVTLKRSGAIAAPAALMITLTSDTAVAGQDFPAGPIGVTFAAGETTKTVEIPLINDTATESGETFKLILTDLPAGAFSARPTALVSIQANDAPAGQPGSLDPTWGSALGLDPEVLPYSGPNPNGIIPVVGGKLIVDVTTYDHDFLYGLRRRILRLNADGSIDPTFPIRDIFRQEPNGHLVDSRSTPLPDGGLLVWGSEDDGTGRSLGYSVHYRLRPDGSVDDAFSGLQSKGYGLLSFFPQSDDKIVVSDPSGPITLDGVPMPRLFRVLDDGSVDPGFNAPATMSGVVTPLSNGKLLVFREGSSPPLVRLNEDGTLDTDFVFPSLFNPSYPRLHPLPSGHLLVGWATKLHRLDPNGSIDPTFVPGTFGIGNNGGSLARIEVQDDGKILLLGYFKSYNGKTVNGVVRLDSEGAIDGSFHSGLGFALNDNPGPFPIPVGAEETWPLSGGRFLVQGSNFDTFDGQSVTPPIILNADGTRDPAFVASLSWWVAAVVDDRPIVWTTTGLGRLIVGAPPVPEIAVEESPGFELTSGDASVSLGSRLVGASTEQTLTIRNLGQAELGGISIAIDGAQAAEFVLTVSPATFVPAGGSTSLTIRFTPLATGTRTATLSLTSTDADESPFTIVLVGTGISPADIAQQAYLKASNTQGEKPTSSGDEFGSAVAVSGSTVVVGAPVEDSSATGINGNQTNNNAMRSGAVYVFVREAGTWSQQAYLKASNTGTNDNFGRALAIDGDTLVVGASSEASGASGVNANQADDSAAGAGAVYVFVRASGQWSQQAYLKASRSSGGLSPGGWAQFGASVAISGETVIVGAPGESSNATGVNGNQANTSARSSGAAYVFVRDGTAWTQQAYLKASNTEADDGFGSSVAISDDTAVVGAPAEDSDATGVNGDQTNNTVSNSGATYVFVRSGGSWSQQAYLKASNTGLTDRFGQAVAVSGDTVVAGASGEDSNAAGINGNQLNNAASNSGAACVFVRQGVTWSLQAYIKASNPGTDDGFGTSVVIEGDALVVGAPNEASSATGINGNQANNSAQGTGAAYVFRRDGTTWFQQAYLKPSNTAFSWGFGWSTGLSDDVLIVGAFGESSSATGVNGNQSNSNAIDSGAAYLFTGISRALTETPLRILEVSRAPDGGTRVSITAQAGARYTLEVSGDLHGWNDLMSRTAAGATIEFNDASAPSAQRFYRVRRE